MRPLSFDMVVMAFLNRADLGLKTQHLGAVFAQDARGRRGVAKGRVLAVFGFDMAVFTVVKSQHLFAVGTQPSVGRRVLARLFDDPFSKGFQNFRMIPKVASFDEC